RDRETRDTLLREKEIHEALSIARKADAALFGIGLPGEGGVLYSAGFIDKKTARELKKAGAAGAVCGRFFDINGHPCPNDLDDRIIGLDLDELKRIKHKIGIALSRQKIKAIMGALRGGLLDVLVTDEDTAVGLLAKS
ncbi:MAG: sugar-binding domain-containing protein, partial [Pseudomonadota bacterium]